MTCERVIVQGVYIWVNIECRLHHENEMHHADQ